MKILNYSLNITTLLFPLVILNFSASSLAAERSQEFDLVIANGRVIDPETELDGVRHVGVKDGVITAVSTTPLLDSLSDGGQLIDASNLVVSPGFIDMHAHGQSQTSNYFQAHDGVTTALELESGYVGLKEWLETKKNSSPINFGASVSQRIGRGLALLDSTVGAQTESELRQLHYSNGDIAEGRFNLLGDADYAALTENQYPAMRQHLLTGLDEGGIGIGLMPGYTPNVTGGEILDVFQFAAEQEQIIFAHVRGGGIGALAMQEVIANTASTGAALHIVHVNSMARGDIDMVLQLISGAISRSLDISTEVYPYTAASTYIQSSLFDEGWQDRFGMGYREIQWVATGERLNKETFDRYRVEGGQVIMYMMQQDWIDRAVAEPYVMIASDGMPYSPGAHPRSAGTFSRLLGRYVRERGVLELTTALRKITLMPAQRLEPYAPAMAKKGRIQVGYDADITVFDADRIIDTATFEDDLSYSDGIQFVIVAGTTVIEEGETIAAVFPGQAITGREFQAR